MKRILVLLFVLAAAQTAQAQTPEKAIVYANANLVGAPGPFVDIVTRGERIVSVAPHGATPDKDADLVDLHGAFVIPGLIDSHVHMATSPNRRFAEALLRRDVYSGITAVRDMAGDARALADLSRSALLGDIASPDIYYAALMAGPQFFKDPRTHAAAQGAVAGQVPWLQAITDKTDMKIAVAEARGTGATGIKIYADLPATLIHDITAEAHTQGILVWSHAAVFPARPSDAIEAGVDVISHVCMLAYQASRDMPPEYHNRAPVDASQFHGDNPIVAKLFDEMKVRGTILDATLWVYDEMAKDHASAPKSPAPYCTPQLAEQILNQAYRAGIPISAGTDGPSPWNAPYPSLNDEIELLVNKAGMTPSDAIRSATRISARTIGKRNEMGAIEPGMLANFAVLAKNPLDDVVNLKTVTLTVKRGVQYKRGDYKPITADEAKGEL